ncbi:MAG: YfhO family protein [Bacteroidetes bacterium]|nr:YfhO family protein [Bacteroidota bacterium]
MKNALIESLTSFSKTHLIILVGFLALALAYMSPVLDGKVLSQHDMTQFDGMKQELVKYHEETGEYSQWTNSLFGGMPAFHVGPSGKIFNVFSRIATFAHLKIPMRNPVSIMFIYLLCFYVLLVALKVNPWVSAIGAIAFAFSSYNLIILDPGHIAKAYAIAYMAPVVAGILLTYRGKYLWGGILFIFGLGLELYSNHLQITYYLLLTALIIVAVKGVFAIREKQLKKFLIASGVLVVAAIIAVLPNFASMWINYEISKQSMRGQPELTIGQEGQTSGLDKSYALAWSYGKAETFSLMIPYMTGGKTGALGENEKAMENVSPQLRETIAGQNQYWGAKASTAGDNYSGAIVVFFFVLGLLLIKGPMRWWIIISSLLSIFLAWGNNFIGFSNFFLDHVPFYNKFRTVEMILVIVCFNIPLLAFLILDRVIKEPELFTENKQKILIAFGLTGGLSLIFFLIPGIFSFFSEREQQIFNQQLAGANAQYASQFRQFMNELEAARISIFRHDAIRSFLLIAIAFVLTWFYARKKVKLTWFLAGLALLITVEMWLVDRRYLNKDNFVSKREQENATAANQADTYILQDPDIHFRVANLTLSPWQDGTNSFYHKSIGGYHGIKLRRYQDLIEGYLSPGLQNIIGALNSKPTAIEMDSVLAAEQVLNMINTKYLILNPNGQPLHNTAAMGHGWLVKNVRIVENPDEEYMALGNTDLTRVAVVDKRFGELISKDLLNSEANGTVKLTEYRPNRMTYQVSAGQKSLAVFSDIYYGESWQASIDGNPVPHLRANYMLRALPIEAGTHTVEFEFEFEPYEKGKIISASGSIIVLLIILSGLAYFIYLSIRTKRE